MTLVLPAADRVALSKTARALGEGRLAIIPTDTVYGLAADVRNDLAVQAIYGLKQRADAYPLQLLFAPDPRLITLYARLNRLALKLIDELGPGGWTIIVPAAEGWSSPALSGGATVGVRIPDEPTAHALVELLGAPLAATSANRSGDPSPGDVRQAVDGLVEAQHEERTGGWWIPFALDAGEAGGIDSTVIDCASGSPQILREGAIDRHTVARILGLQDIPVTRSVRT